jgi:DNA-directed RNA polymerase specialized sigma24 family protein
MLGDRAAAEDVAAEAMTRAFLHWDQIGSSASYRTGWVLQVTTNLAIDGIRSKGRRAELPADGFPAIADIQDGSALRVTLTTAFRALPRRQREAIVLHYLVHTG